MSDPDRTHDINPTGCPPAEEDSDADTDAATTANASSSENAAIDSSEHDTDDFLRWLPTLALGHRRRTELVERPASDGADFAAYACEGRPAAASGRAPLEAVVNVQTTPDGQRPRTSKDLERDAPTVRTRKKIEWRRSSHIGWGAVLLCAAGAGVATWAGRPVAVDKTSRRSEPAQTAPVPIGRPSTQASESEESATEPAPAPSQTSSIGVVRTAAPDRRAPSSNAFAADVVRKKDSARAPKPIASSARPGTGPLTVPAKDQYFEAP